MGDRTTVMTFTVKVYDSNGALYKTMQYDSWSKARKAQTRYESKGYVAFIIR